MYSFLEVCWNIEEEANILHTVHDGMININITVILIMFMILGICTSDDNKWRNKDKTENTMRNGITVEKYYKGKGGECPLSVRLE